MPATDLEDCPLINTFRNLPVKKEFIIEKIPPVIHQLEGLSSKPVRHNVPKAFKISNVIALEMCLLPRVSSILCFDKV